MSLKINENKLNTPRFCETATCCFSPPIYMSKNKLLQTSFDCRKHSYKFVPSAVVGKLEYISPMAKVLMTTSKDREHLLKCKILDKQRLYLLKKCCSPYNIHFYCFCKARYIRCNIFIQFPFSTNIVLEKHKRTI